IELNRQKPVLTQLLPAPAQLPAQYQTPPPRSHDSVKPLSPSPAPIPVLPSPPPQVKQQSEILPIRPHPQLPAQYPPLSPLPSRTASPSHSNKPRLDIAPMMQPQVRPRPVQFQPQLHQALPIPRQLATSAHNPLKDPHAHSNRPSVHLAPAPLPAIAPSYQEPVPLPPVPIKKVKPAKARKQHRAPDAKHASFPQPPVSQPAAPVVPVTLPPPTIPKHTATTAKSSFLSYFSFGKKDEVKPPEPVPVPLPLVVTVPSPKPHPNQHHHQRVPIDRYQTGAAESSFKEPSKAQKFPKTTKNHKQNKQLKKHHAQHFPPSPPPPPQTHEEYPIPPTVPIPPPKYDEPHRPLETHQQVKTTVSASHTPYTPPPPPATKTATPQATFRPTHYQASVETQGPYSHAPNYTPPPGHTPQFLFGYQPNEVPQQHQQVQYYHLQAQNYQQKEHAPQQAQHHVHPQPPRQQQHFVQPQAQAFFHQQHHSQQQQSPQQQQKFHIQHSHPQQQSFQQPQALLVQVPQSLNPTEQIELPPEMLKALGVKNVSPGVQKQENIGQNSASVVGHLSNGQGVVVLDEVSNRPYVRPNTGNYHTSAGLYGSPVPVDVSKTPFTKGIPHGFPAPSKIQVDEKTQVSLSGVVLPHNGGLKTTYNELPPTQVNLNEPLNVHIPISQLPPRPAVNVRIKGPDGKISEVLVPLHESNIKNGGFQLPPIGGLLGQSTRDLNGPPKKYGHSDYYAPNKLSHPHRGLTAPHAQAFARPNHQGPLFGSPSSSFLQYVSPVGPDLAAAQQDPLQTAASTPPSSWIGGWGSSIRNVGSRIGSIFSRKASSS
ncbi:hypothetical protein BIW11_03558, partial [Tropilaelaps mercedesae]